ncbi:hypothetical protein [Actinomadura rudentiformis]|uniref:Uncharacterized protein n=1 Tax=Actinomadura rudentiformis TaxID=359158 RepID=A0A6H9YVZ7_9ACTN|nr:hypothetical protein [Actinomadura rudentiformis]KAB2344886.1 hypothetical protein F8566_30315 [Actinomadura rudentiformis]
MSARLRPPLLLASAAAATALLSTPAHADANVPVIDSASEGTVETVQSAFGAVDKTAGGAMATVDQAPISIEKR